MATLDPISSIVEELCNCAQGVLGTDWKKIKYLEDLEKNHNLTQNRVFGIRALEASEVEGIMKYVTLDQTFELVMVRSKLSKANGDSDIRKLSYENRDQAFCVYKKIAQTHLGGLALIVNNLVISEPEFIEEDKVVVQRITFNIRHRCKI